MISVFSAYIKGLQQAWHEKRLILVVYGFNLFFAYLITIPVSMMLEKGFANRIAATEMLHKFDLTYYLTIIRDFGAGLDVTRVILTFGLLYIVLNTFFAGGILTLFHRQEKFTLGDFFSGCVEFFSRFLRLFLFSLILFLLSIIIFFLLGALSGLITDNAATEFWPFLLFFLREFLLVLLLLFFNIILDYARIMTVVNDFHGMYQALKQAFMFVLMSMRRTMALYLLYLLTTVSLILMYLVVEHVLSVSSWITVLLFFIWSQLFMIARMWSRLSLFAGQYIFYKFSNTAMPGMTKEMLDKAVMDYEARSVSS